MGREMPEEKIEPQGYSRPENSETEQPQSDLESGNSKIEEKRAKLKKIELLMKQFIATGVTMIAIVSAMELGARIMGIRPEGEKVKLEKIEDIEYRDGILRSEDIKKFLDT